MKHVLYAALDLTLCVGCAKQTGTTTPSPPTNTPQSIARDTAAALNGAITNAQAKSTAQCVKDNTQSICREINRGVVAQNTLITALETYCSWSATTAPPDPNAPCKPVDSALGALTAATTNAATLVTEINSF